MSLLAKIELYEKRERDLEQFERDTCGQKLLAAGTVIFRRDLYALLAVATAALGVQDWGHAYQCPGATPGVAECTCGISRFAKALDALAEVLR